MNATELYLKDGKSAGIYYCEKCRVVKRTEQEAKECCQPQRCCECGGITKPYYTACPDCIDLKRRLVMREKFKNAEKIAEWDGWVYVEGCGPNDGYFPSIDDCLDWFEVEQEDDEEINVPPFAWACHKSRICDLDYDAIIENSTEYAYEDWEPDRLTGVEEFKKAIEIFNEINKEEVYYTPNYKKAVLLNLEIVQNKS